MKLLKVLLTLFFIPLLTIANTQRVWVVTVPEGTNPNLFAGINAGGNVYTSSNNVFNSDTTNSFMGRVGIGTNTPSIASLEVTSATGLPMRVISVSAIADRTLTLEQYNDATSPAVLVFKKARGTPQVPTAISSGDRSGNVQFNAYDGYAYRNSATIRVYTEGTIASNSVPMHMDFYTGTNDTDNVERMRIASNGRVGIGTTSPSAPLDVVTTPSLGSLVSRFATTAADPFFISQKTGTVNGSLFVLGNNMFADSAGNVVTTNRLTTGQGFYVNNRNGASSIYAVFLASNTAAATLPFMIDGTNGNVGVGTTTPASLLHASGLNKDILLDGSFVVSTTNKLKISNGQTLGGATEYSTALALMTSPAGVYRSCIMNNYAGVNREVMTFEQQYGYVGIGISSPVVPLQVYGAGFGPQMRVDGSNASRLDFYGNGTASPDMRNYALSSANNAYGMFEILQSTTSNTAPTVARFVIDKSGSVGVGTITPGYRLHVVQDQASTVAGMLTTFNPSLPDGSFVYNAVGKALGAYTAGLWGYTKGATTPTSRFWFGHYGDDIDGQGKGLIIAGGGNIGLGTPTPECLLTLKASALNTNNGIKIIGSGAVDALYIYPSADNVTTIEAKINADQTPGPIVINPSGGNVGIGTNNPTRLLHLYGGAYCDGTGDWIAGSDIGYKKDILPLSTATYGLSAVLKLNPITYIHKQDVKNTEQIGFIAQDVLPILPEVVSGTNGGYGIAYARFAPVLVNAIKDLNAKIDKNSISKDETTGHQIVEEIQEYKGEGHKIDLTVQAEAVQELCKAMVAQGNNKFSAYTNFVTITKHPKKDYRRDLKNQAETQQYSGTDVTLPEMPIFIQNDQKVFDNVHPEWSVDKSINYRVKKGRKRPLYTSDNSSRNP